MIKVFNIEVRKATHIMEVIPSTGDPSVPGGSLPHLQG